MTLTQQEKVWLVDQLDDYFEEVEMRSAALMVSETIVNMLESVLMNETIEDQEHAVRAKIGNYFWDNQVCYGKDCFSSGTGLNGKPFTYKDGEVINVSEIMEILKRFETEDFDEIGLATNQEKGEATALAQEMLRETYQNREEITEKIKPFIPEEETV